MSESKPTRCPSCGSPMPSGSDEAFCAACLLSEAIGDEDPTLKLKTRNPATPSAISQSKIREFPFELGGFRILRLLGQGGMGAVYEAEDTATNRLVALKVLELHIDSPDMHQRFLREGRLAASINHPNSLYIYGCEDIDGRPVITMEIAKAGTLSDKLRSHGPFSVRAAVDAILDIISGLEAAYSGGVLHRDVKPSNCFLDPDGSVKVGDFGLSVSTLSRDNSYATASGVIMGTPTYASPEQLRGDELDVRADIYSVGATLFTLLTGKVPFDGKNAVQVVANAMNRKPKRISEFRKDIPAGLDSIVSRCLSKEPDGRFPDYESLRHALLPFSSREPEPASMKVRAAAGWIDYLAAFFIPYITLMLSMGAEKFHWEPMIEKTLLSWRFYFTFIACGFLYFTLLEGLWGAGLGKRLLGLRLVRTDGKRPGMLRALFRIMIPILVIEGVRIPSLLATISLTDFNQITGKEIFWYVGLSNLCPWLAVLMALNAKPENGYATMWDRLSGTRVVRRQKHVDRPALAHVIAETKPAQDAPFVGPFQWVKAIEDKKWNQCYDPVLRRQVWLFLRTDKAPTESRRFIGRPGRLRWLQEVRTKEGIWDAYEAPKGLPFVELTRDRNRISWSRLRHWVHDIACEFWAASGDGTLPDKISLDHIWITQSGTAVLLDAPWPEQQTKHESVSVAHIKGQQNFLKQMTESVELTSIPVHAQKIIANLKESKFEKISFLAGTLRGLLERPAELNKPIRAGSIFMLPVYVIIMVIVGAKNPDSYLPRLVIDSTYAVLLVRFLAQILSLPFKTTCSYSIFRLTVINADGQPAGIGKLFLQRVIVWTALHLPAWCIGMQWTTPGTNLELAGRTIWLLLWISAAVYAVMHPNRGLHNRILNTWVVRR